MILLDTATFLWIIAGSEKLSQKAKNLYLDEKNKLYLSSVSLWEIMVKHELGRLPLPQAPAKYIPHQQQKHGIETMALDESDVSKLEDLPKIHQDPFDRMLVCQALARNLTMLTSDSIVQKYPVKTVW